MNVIEAWLAGLRAVLHGEPAAVSDVRIGVFYTGGGLGRGGPGAGVPGGARRPGVDALQAAGVGPEDRVAMVGAFVPFIKALKGRVARLWVVDKHPDALKGDER